MREPDTGLPRLLVIDDEEEICDFVRFTAENLGYEVLATHNPRDFPRLYSDLIDIIVLDLTMPGFDGIEIIRFLSNGHSRAALILMSGFDPGVLNAAQILAQDRGLNVLGILEKPFTIDRLRDLLNSTSRDKSFKTAGGMTEAPKIEELENALENRDLLPFYQPRVDLNTFRLTGVEALARWRHRTNGIIGPASFISILEKTDLINVLTSQILDQALQDSKAWKENGIDCQVSINCSARVLNDLDFPDLLLDTISERGLSPSQVIIEVTESAVIEELATSLDILTRLRLKGIHLSIDDFGTGYSSIKQLQRIPFDELKIDRSFVESSTTDKDSRAIIEATIALAHKLKMIVVAEGIETLDQWQLLSDFGCDQGQGFFMARPMPGNELPAWLEGWNGPVSVAMNKPT